MLARAIAGARTRRGRVAETVGLLLLFYVPYFLSSPGRVSADSKQALYLDPGAFLARAPHLWDEQMGAGTVSHQHIGFLWPMGPWFWLFDAVGVPDWVAQRLWLGTVTALAGFGARWLARQLGAGRSAALAAALVYGLTPYQLAFTARISVLLLPWAGLPWLIGLTDRALRRGRWREPAAIALVVLTIGSVNASSLLLVGLGPLLWLLLSPRPPTAARRVGVAVRVGVLTVGTTLWWIIGLRLEGAYGLPLLQVSENLETVSARSSPLEALRGLGDWFFYGRDRLGFSIDQASDYLHDRPTAVFTFGLAAVATAAGTVLRWTHRRTFVAFVSVGVVVAVGAYPFDDPSPYGDLLVGLSDGSSIGLALRNSTRALPLVVLGLAGLLVGAIQACRSDRLRVGGAAVVVALALGSLLPVWTTGYLSDALTRADPVPAYWTAAAAALDDGDPSTRVLELPGAPFATYRWGNTVDSVLTSLTDRDQLAREVQPFGSEASALLVDALDRRIQEGTFEPGSLVPVARLFGIGDVLVRSDLDTARSGTPDPAQLWAGLTDPAVDGLGAPATFGDPAVEGPARDGERLDERDLASGAPTATPPPVAVFPVVEPVPIARTGAAAGVVLLGGDGEGIVDSAAAGLLDGDAAVFEVAALDDAALAAVLEGGTDLVLTDTNRRRIQTWFYAIRDTRGPTEQAGESLDEPTGYDFRLDPFDESGDDSHTVVEQVGGTVDADGGGGAGRPEDRPAAAADGDVRTSWRTGGADPTELRWSLEPDQPARTDHLTIVQPLDGPRDRAVRRVAVSLNGARAFDVELGPESFTEAGQRVAFPERDVRRVELRITEVDDPPFDPALANAVGFAEVRLGDVQIREVVRVPVDLLERVGAAGRRLDVVLTRLRRDPADRGRLDEELSLQRSFTLPAARSFGLDGTIRIDPNAPDGVLDDLLGTDLGGAAIEATSRLAGDHGSRASRAFDGDPATAWQSAFGPQEEQALAVRLPAPTELDGLRAVVVADGRHSVPTRLRVEVDGVAIATAGVDPSAGPLVEVDLPDPVGPVQELRIVVESVDAVPSLAGDGNPGETLPVAVATVSATGLPVASDGPVRVGDCRPLVEVDGATVEVRAVGGRDEARRGWALESCDGPLALAAGPHEIRSVVGLDAGLDVDRLVLSSDPGGGPGSVAPRGLPRAASGATVVVDDRRRDSMDLTVTSDGEPFWLVLGASDNAGWDLDVERAEVGARTLVDGYANGWLVSPDEPGTFSASLEWVPQEQVWIGMVISALAIALCLFLLVFPRRVPAVPEAIAAEPTFAGPPASARPLPAGTAAAVAAVVGIAALYVSTPLAAIVAVVAVALGALVGPTSWVAAALAAGAIVAGRILDEPLLGWIPPALLVVDVVLAEARRRRSAPG